MYYSRIFASALREIERGAAFVVSLFRQCGSYFRSPSGGRAPFFDALRSGCRSFFDGLKKAARTLGSWFCSLFQVCFPSFFVKSGSCDDLDSISVADSVSSRDFTKMHECFSPARAACREMDPDDPEATQLLEQEELERQRQTASSEEVDSDYDDGRVISASNRCAGQARVIITSADVHRVASVPDNGQGISV